MTRQAVTNGLLYSTALIIAMAFALQYPLSTTFPIGGDAPFHVEGAQRILRAYQNPNDAITALQESWYPISHLIFSTSIILPTSWPQRFTWYMALGHVVAGIAISAFTWRVAGPRGAALALVLWSITTIEITRHFEDGTLAQLWSLVFLAIFFERVAAKSWWLLPIIFGLVSLTHPITGFTLLASIVTFAPIAWSQRKAAHAYERKQFYSLSAIIVVSAVGTLFIGKNLAGAIIEGASSSNLIDLLGSHFAPLLLLAPIGLLITITNHQVSLTTRIIFGLFGSLSLLLAANDLLEISVWTERLRSQLILVIVIGAAIALARSLSS